MILDCLDTSSSSAASANGLRQDGLVTLSITCLASSAKRNWHLRAGASSALDSPASSSVHAPAKQSCLAATICSRQAEPTRAALVDKLVARDPTTAHPKKSAHASETRPPPRRSRPAPPPTTTATVARAKGGERGGRARLAGWTAAAAAAPLLSSSFAAHRSCTAAQTASPQMADSLDPRRPHGLAARAHRRTYRAHRDCGSQRGRHPHRGRAPMTPSNAA